MVGPLPLMSLSENTVKQHNAVPSFLGGRHLSTNTVFIRKRYCHSKLANIIHARALNDRYREKGISAYSVHPGVINTNLQNAGQGPFSAFVKYACRWYVIAFIVFF